MLFTQAGDAGADSPEDPQAEQAEHGHKGKVAGMDRLAGGGEKRLELQVREPKGPVIRRGPRGGGRVRRASVPARRR
jgi:hypothetical protein